MVEGPWVVVPASGVLGVASVCAAAEGRELGGGGRGREGVEAFGAVF